MRSETEAPSGSETPSDGEVRSGGVGTPSGACSRTTWAFVPLIPNADTPARRGRPVCGHGLASASSDTVPPDQST